MLTMILAGALAAATAPRVDVASDVFVEQLRDSGRVLQPVRALRRGDRVVTIVTWKRSGTGGSFTVTNPLPRALQFEGSAEGAQEVSADGGRTWGRLGMLKTGGHVAAPEEVTHVRWRVVTPGTEGRIAYSAIVR